MTVSDKDVNNELVSKLNETFKAYLAGLFDGEGCVNATIGTRRYFPKRRQKAFCLHAWGKLQFVISSKNSIFLQWIRDKIGFGEVYKRWNYRITKREQVLSIVNALIPFAVLKQDELQLTKDTALFMLQREHRSKWTKEELILFRERFIFPLQKLLPSGKRRGRPPKYSFDEILSLLC